VQRLLWKRWYSIVVVNSCSNSYIFLIYNKHHYTAYLLLQAASPQYHPHHTPGSGNTSHPWRTATCNTQREYINTQQVHVNTLHVHTNTQHVHVNTQRVYVNTEQVNVNTHSTHTLLSSRQSQYHSINPKVTDKTLNKICPVNNWTFIFFQYFH